MRRYRFMVRALEISIPKSDDWAGNRTVVLVCHLYTQGRKYILQGEGLKLECASGSTFFFAEGELGCTVEVGESEKEMGVEIDLIAGGFGLSTFGIGPVKMDELKAALRLKPGFTTGNRRTVSSRSIATSASL